MSSDALPTQHRSLTGWGATSPSAARVFPLALRTDTTRGFEDPPPRGVIGRGLGRAYGDAAQNAGGRVVDTTGLSDIELDTATGLVTATAGTSIDALLRALVPRGFFVPVTPGTRFVTVGGAIASDIHGKNHHVKGTWCRHVESFRLLIPSGEVLDVSPTSDPKLFWATAGGMGLTGVIVDATFRCPAIETSRVSVDTFRAPDLDTVLGLMADEDAWEYTVAWIDLLATGKSLGRSVLTAGNFATLEQLAAGDPRAARDDPRAFDPQLLVTTPPLLPSGLLNRYAIRAFNEVWFRKAPAHREHELQTITQFFHPLDGIGAWNRAYGPQGFLQWQPVVPLAATDALRTIIERLSAARCASLVNVLKRFGPANEGYLSFPIDGWTLSVDIPCGTRGLVALLDDLDGLVADAGGRVYLAKDSRLRPDLLATMYPRLDEWRAVRRSVDPDGILQSDLARRLSLT